MLQFFNNIKILTKYIFPKRISMIQRLCSVIIFILFIMIIMTNAVISGVNDKFTKQIISTKGDINIKMNNLYDKYSENTLSEYKFINKTIPSSNLQSTLYSDSNNKFYGTLSTLYKKNDLKYKLNLFNFNYNNTIFSKKYPNIFIGKNLAQQSQLQIGDITYMYILPEMKDHSITSIFANKITQKCHISGILSTDNVILDTVIVLGDINEMSYFSQRNINKYLNQLEVYTDSYEKSDIYSNQIKKDYPKLSPISWKEEFKSIYNIFQRNIKIKNVFLNIFLFILILINIICILMFYYIKKKEIGILISLGASRLLIISIFVISSLKYIIFNAFIGSILTYFIITHSFYIGEYLSEYNFYNIFDGLILFVQKSNLIITFDYILYLNIFNLFSTILISLSIVLYIYNISIYEQIR